MGGALVGNPAAAAQRSVMSDGQNMTKIMSKRYQTQL